MPLGGAAAGRGGGGAARSPPRGPQLTRPCCRLNHPAQEAKAAFRFFMRWLKAAAPGVPVYCLVAGTRAQRFQGVLYDAAAAEEVSVAKVLQVRPPPPGALGAGRLPPVARRSATTCSSPPRPAYPPTRPPTHPPTRPPAHPPTHPPAHTPRRQVTHPAVWDARDAARVAAWAGLDGDAQRKLSAEATPWAYSEEALPLGGAAAARWAAELKKLEAEEAKLGARVQQSDAARKQPAARGAKDAAARAHETVSRLQGMPRAERRAGHSADLKHVRRRAEKQRRWDTLRREHAAAVAAVARHKATKAAEPARRPIDDRVPAFWRAAVALARVAACAGDRAAGAARRAAAVAHDAGRLAAVLQQRADLAGGAAAQPLAAARLRCAPALKAAVAASRAAAKRAHALAQEASKWARAAPSPRAAAHDLRPLLAPAAAQLASWVDESPALLSAVPVAPNLRSVLEDDDPPTPDAEVRASGLLYGAGGGAPRGGSGGRRNRQRRAPPPRAVLTTTLCAPPPKAFLAGADATLRACDLAAANATAALGAAWQSLARATVDAACAVGARAAGAGEGAGGGQPAAGGDAAPPPAAGEGPRAARAARRASGTAPSAPGAGHAQAPAGGGAAPGAGGAHAPADGGGGARALAAAVEAAKRLRKQLGAAKHAARRTAFSLSPLPHFKTGFVPMTSSFVHALVAAYHAFEKERLAADQGGHKPQLPSWKPGAGFTHHGKPSAQSP